MVLTKEQEVLLTNLIDQWYQTNHGNDWKEKGLLYNNDVCLPIEEWSKQNNIDINDINIFKFQLFDKLKDDDMNKMCMKMYGTDYKTCAYNYNMVRILTNFFNADDGYSLKEMTSEDGNKKKVFVKWLGECDCDNNEECKCNDKFDICEQSKCYRHLNFSIKPYFTTFNF